MSLVCYSYYETKASMTNLCFFMRHGIVPDTDYILVVNGHKCSAKLPPGVKVLRRENTGGDFGAWGAALSSIGLKTYTRFVFLNDTVRGPFLPRYIQHNTTWVDLLTSRLGEKIKLVGPTMNSRPWGQITPGGKHVQSMCFCTDLKGLQILLRSQIFCVSDTGSKNEGKSDDARKKFILEHEIGMSQALINAGYEVTSLQLSDNSAIPTGDIHFPGKYFGTTVHPLEVMFVKSERFMAQSEGRRILELCTRFCYRNTDV